MQEALRKIDYTQEKALHNWVEKLDLACTSPATIGLLGSSLFLGWTMSLLWLPRLADVQGRATIFRISVLLAFMLLTLIYMSFNIY